ncbi:MAG: hypothetical protein HON42_03330 [Alphaproteobacteria bacterium]|nr:hypothetical protein [Alphaproteobacteria bacterium]
MRLFRCSRQNQYTIKDLVKAIIVKNDLEEIKKIIAGVANVNLAPTNGPLAGKTPLFIAARKGQLAVAKLLIDSGAEVNLAPTNGPFAGTTPLFIAARKGKLDVAKLLLERRADVNQTNTYGETPLFIAARKGQLDVAQLLLDNRADVNKADKYGRTPLFIATFAGQLAVAQLLLERKANVNQATTIGITPLFIAEIRANKQITLLLKLSGASEDIDLETNDEVIKQALKASAMLQIITQSFPASATDLLTAIETSLANITNIDDLLKFSRDLETKFNKVIHPGSTISHMVSQFLSGKLSDALIREIANPKTKNLFEPDLENAITTKATIVAKTIAAQLQDITRFAKTKIVAAEVDAQPAYLAELIARLNVLLESNLPDNIAKNGDATYTYHYDTGDRAAKKTIDKLVESELTELNSQIDARLARQSAAAQEAGGQAAARTAEGPQNLSHTGTVAETVTTTNIPAQPKGWENRIKERNKKPDDQRYAALRAQKGPMGYSV